MFVLKSKQGIFLYGGAREIDTMPGHYLFTESHHFLNPHVSLFHSLLSFITWFILIISCVRKKEIMIMCAVIEKKSNQQKAGTKPGNCYQPKADYFLITTRNAD